MLNDPLAMQDGDSDAALLDRWRGGDRAAGETIVERHYDAVERFFRTKAPAQAEDLVQRTFLALIEAAGRFRAESSFRAFLFGIARNVLLEVLRKKARDGGRDLDVGLSSIADLGLGAATLLGAERTRHALAECLQRLPVDLQLAVELHYWEDLPIGDLAEVLGVPPGTVKSRLHRARGLLKEAMDGLALTDGDRRELARALGRSS